MTEFGTNLINISAEEWGVISFDTDGKPYIAKAGDFFYFDANGFIEKQLSFQNPKAKTIFQVAFPQQIKTYVPTNDLPWFVDIRVPEGEPVKQMTPSLNICIEDKKGDKVYGEYTYKKDDKNRPIYREVDERKGADEQLRPMEPSRNAKQTYLDNLTKK
jgi:hypothetical protein